MRAALLLAFLVGCAHHVGDICLEGDAYCGDSKTDPRSALACRGGNLVRFDCLGPKGCRVDAARTVSCDQSEGASVGRPCFTEYEGTGQCNGVALLQCVRGNWAQVACPQGQYCSDSGGYVGCK